ncbi:MAG: single-stranded DNA-binding protein [Bacilli bacterium]|nr:single-stranded DNA-binding protein [Bacilli bacterium]
MNNIELIGRLTKDPEQRKTQSGKSVSSFTLAVNRRSKEDPTDFINCVAWEKRSDFIQKYIEKGNRVYVRGRLEGRSYDKPDGTRVNIWEVIVDDVEPIDWKEKKENQYEYASNYSKDVDDSFKKELDITSDDLPF